MESQNRLINVAVLAHSGRGARCPLLGVKRTFSETVAMSAFDPTATLAVHCGNGFDAGSRLSLRCCPLSVGAEMRRREFISFLGGAAAWPLGAQAQQPSMALVGLLLSTQLDDRQIGAIRQGLKDAGYIEGRNLAIKYRSADSRFDRLPAMAAELVADPVAAIVALGPRFGSKADIGDP
jgi:hypothetical protein